MPVVLAKVGHAVTLELLPDAERPGAELAGAGHEPGDIHLVAAHGWDAVGAVTRS